ncbi:MAG: sugar transferase, partial [Kovacikia sp.]
MTAESQLIPGKTLRAFFKRGFIPVLLNGLDGGFFKRLFDVLFSLTILIVFSPVYLLLMLLIALSSSGPIFYVQERVGRNFKPFGCIKFRTMVSNADEVLMEMMETSPRLRQEFRDNFK